MSLLELLPPVKRARAYRLYTEKGRFLDLYLDGGRAALGHNPPAVLRELKNAAERSLFAPYPSFWVRRFEKALRLLFPEAGLRVFPCLEAVPPKLRDGAKIWRPFIENAAQPFLALLPHPLAPVVYAAPPPRAFSFSSPLPPVVLALATRAIYDVLHSPERGLVEYSKITRALENGFWRKDGIYLFLAEPVGKENWEKLFMRFLEAGILIPPEPDCPLILPGELSPGEEAKLAKMLGQGWRANKVAEP